MGRYELKTSFDDLTAGQWELNVGQVYSTLDRMLRDDLVAIEESDGSRNDRKVYRITEGGLEELESWLQFPPLQSQPYRSEVYVRLALLVERDLAACPPSPDGRPDHDGSWPLAAPGNRLTGSAGG